MRKKIFKTLLFTSIICSLFTMGANAEWRQINEGIWKYYDENNVLVRDSYVDGKYYVDSNGLWINRDYYNANHYCTIGYTKEDGQVQGISGNDIPWSRVDLHTGIRTCFNILFYKEEDIENARKDGDVFRDYKISNVDGVYKLQKIK